MLPSKTYLCLPADRSPESGYSSLLKNVNSVAKVCRYQICINVAARVQQIFSIGDFYTACYVGV